jgi:protein-S-isoprenylcysteine O-methyltransferase Ste14
MFFRAELEKSGSWLFRYRSFLALAGFPMIAAGLKSFTYIDHSHRINEWWQIVCFSISMSGLALRIFTIGFVPRRTSGRNTDRQIADTLNITGMYSIVRNPLYLGNFLMMLGFAMFFHHWWLVFTATFICALSYYCIVQAEEAFLRERFGVVYERWAAERPAFIPKLSAWKRPALPFCWRTVLRREYTGFFIVTAGFFLLDVIGDSIAEGRLRVGLDWGIVFAIGAVTYVTLRTLKKHTRLLSIKRR